jgi:hypothetical protein
MSRQSSKIEPWHLAPSVRCRGSEFLLKTFACESHRSRFVTSAMSDESQQRSGIAKKYLNLRMSSIYTRQYEDNLDSRASDSSAEVLGFSEYEFIPSPASALFAGTLTVPRWSMTPRCNAVHREKT